MALAAGPPVFSDHWQTSRQCHPRHDQCSRSSLGSSSSPSVAQPNRRSHPSRSTTCATDPFPRVSVLQPSMEHQHPACREGSLTTRSSVTKTLAGQPPVPPDEHDTCAASAWCDGALWIAARSGPPGSPRRGRRGASVSPEGSTERFRQSQYACTVIVGSRIGWPLPTFIRNDSPGSSVRL